MRNKFNNSRRVPFKKVPFVFSIFLFLFTSYFLNGSDYKNEFIPPDPECRTPFKAKYLDHDDGSCDYPSQIYDMLKGDINFVDNESKNIYIKVSGNVFPGNILLEPKSGTECFFNESIPGPQCVEGCSDEQNCNITDMGTWDSIACSIVSPPISTHVIGSGTSLVTVHYYGYEIDGSDSYWYYQIVSGYQPSIGHITFGLICPNASLGDYVWDDLNENGEQDVGEPGINGVVVELYDKDMNFLKSMITQSTLSAIEREGSYRDDNSDDGHYMFSDLPAGDYYVMFECPEDHEISPEHNCGDNVDVDSDIHADVIHIGMGITDMITLASSEDNMTIDAGFNLVALPVRFGDFTIELVRDKIELKWSTLSEINSVGFYIEKSICEASDFQEIAFVESAGNSNALKEYTYTDVNIGRSNLVAYRIRQVDTDGNATYSAIRSISLQAINDYEFYPNPTTGVISLNLPESSTDKQIRVYNTTGQMLYSVNVSQATIYCQLDLSELENGVYLILMDAGIHSKIKKVILNY